MKIFLNNFIALLRKSRELKGFTQQEIATHSQISLRTYQRIESGESEPTLSQIYLLAHLLEFNVTEIFNFQSNLTLEQQMLWRMTKQFEKIGHQARIGLWEYDVSEKKLIWSSVTKEIYEVEESYTPQIDTAINYYKEGYSRTSIENAVHNCLSKAEPYTLELKLITAKKNEIDVIASGLPEVINGKVTKIYGTFQDITATKVMQFTLENSLKELNYIQNFGGFGRWELNLELNKLDWSESLFNIFEIPSKEFKASYEAFLNLVHPDDRTKVDFAYTNSLKTKQPYEIEHRLLMPDGRVKWILEKCISYFTEEGKPVKSIGYALDITKYK